MKTKLTRKQKAFADALLNNPKLSATEAAAQTYGKPDKELGRHTAEVIASENMRKPEVLAYFYEHDELAQQRITELSLQDEDRNVALRASQDILDRVHGKATQRLETSNKSVSINIDLSASPSQEANN
jgi:phage terminase small subunit